MDKLEPQITTASEGDLEEILRLQKLAFKSEADFYNFQDITPMVQTIEETREEFKDQVFFKAVLNGRIVGSVRGFEKDGTCYVRRLIVHPDFQNRGIGKKLMAALESRFNNVRRFELLTGHKSAKNLALYRGLGYKEFKTEKVDDRLSEVFMEKIRIDETRKA